MFYVYYFLEMVCVLISVGFVTLLERSVLGYVQLRKGPNSVGLLGIVQPFSDGISLFFKEQVYLVFSNFLIYYVSPVFMLFLSFLLWVLLPTLVNVYNFSFGCLFLLVVLGAGVYGLLMSGWGSNSSYAFLGALRSVAQVISYEVSLALIVVDLLILTCSFDLVVFLEYQSYSWFVLFLAPVFICWLGSIMAEVGRSPFDLIEGESELVSGFNIEYSAGGFSIIFMSEYMNIVFLSMMSCVLFLGCDLYSLFFFIKLLFMVFMYLWVRASLPRCRYDKLMYLVWKFFLPATLGYFLFLISVVPVL